MFKPKEICDFIQGNGAFCFGCLSLYFLRVRVWKEVIKPD